jgi:NAD+ diphosphatase
VLVFSGNRLLVRTDSQGIALPLRDELAALDLEPDIRLHLGSIETRCYCCWRLGAAPDLPAKISLAGLRSLHRVLGEEEFHIAGYALHLLTWIADNRHCGRCGNRMILEKGDRALSCSVCGHLLYPRISPAIIVAITSGNRLLLARSGRFPQKRMFSVIAGYVEPGETLEDCVRREVREEVGLRLRNIRYFGSQSWPFSGSLMVGFTAEQAGGEITVDGREILEAGWFAADQLPEIPGKISIARQLIDWFVDTYS